ncbi:glycerol-3-phosphate dehydrogenase [Vibrio sp. SM6]|uniref:Glycerol-3-phosphate dehydrogenase n=1 Tax=Vibrio agarilyticus TaxID=2726741 RepID=A0A7X8TRE7_9VIBR|nr:glycerol-3-phosphate dehydrogenase [Vibrio agarilyticus]NLS13446.1 glycerol-3-phosphate dehydrogenase [Vibrio agarilyticus]
MAVYDVIVVGGGINGAGIAADAAGRGLNTALFEANDFASATSSSSSKLIHGGLRYLEHYEFRLVAEALAEREILLNKARHITRPMRFRLPHRPYLRSRLMISAGLFLYDRLAKRKALGKSTRVDLAASGLFIDAIKTGFEYSDCWVDDARLVIANIQAAQRKKAQVHNYCEVTQVKVIDGLWQVSLFDKRLQKARVEHAKVLINAAGPWAEQFIEQKAQRTSPHQIRLVRGSHFIVPKLYEGDEAYILQHHDKRIVFVIPYLNQYSMVGTTDVEHTADPSQCSMSDEERDYLLEVVNAHFAKPVRAEAIISSFSGVRPLCSDDAEQPQRVTRDYTLSLQTHQGAPILSIFGGKLTTYRKLAEAALAKLAPFFPTMGGTWTDKAFLPGGDIVSLSSWKSQLKNQFPWLPTALLERYATLYGSEAALILAGARCVADLGEEIAPDLYQRELDHLIHNEFVYHASDVLERRTKLGLGYTNDQIATVDRYLQHHCSCNFAYQK